MVNKSIVTKALNRESQITAPDDFKQTLLSEGYIVWQLPEFEKYKLTETPITLDFSDSIEEKNQDLYAALLRSHFDVAQC